MALDANILLRGITPSLGAAVSQGFQIGQGIKNAPLRSQLLDLQAQQIGQQIKNAPLRSQLLDLQAQRQGQAVQSASQDIGQSAALAAFQIFGDTPADQITQEQFNVGIQTADRLGVPLGDQERAFNPQNVAGMASLAQAGKQASLQRRGGGQTGFQTNAPIITEKDGQKYLCRFGRLEGNTDTRMVRLIRAEILYWREKWHLPQSVGL